MSTGELDQDDPFGDEELDIHSIPEDVRLRIAGLMVTIGELDSLRPAIRCAPDTTIRAAVETMHRERMGYVLVVEGDELAGVFTERDLLRVIAEGQVDIDHEPVSSVMTARPECLGAEYPLVYAINQMSVGGYRHVPVLDKDGRPIHVISARTVIEHLAGEFPKEVLNLPPDPSLTIAPTPEGA